MMRLSIAGWIESLLFATAVLLYISGESGWILVYAIGISAVLSVTTCAVSRRNFTISCSGCSGLHHVGDTVTVELELTPQGFCFLPYITISGRFLGQRFTARGSALGKSGKIRISLTAPGMRTQPPGDRLGDPEGFPRDSVPEFQSAPGAGGGGCTAADRGLHRAGGAAEPAPVGR